MTDSEIRKAVYEMTLQGGRPPSIGTLSIQLRTTPADIREGIARLVAARVLVPDPRNGEILMAPPFSAVPTPFLVETSRHWSFANCIWDALGVPVMLRMGARIATACACCGTAMTLETDGTAAPGGEGLIHFAVPARQWWDDIVFT